MGDSEKVSGTHAFLIGTPKSGTTWLAATLSQNPDICVSNPKEPNIIATHKGTFSRSVEEPDWELYESFFEGKGIRLDASIHAFSCPLAPMRIFDRFEDPRFILSFREPVSRIFSHWRMIVDNGEAHPNGADWSEFKSAWEDERLRCDSRYGSSMERWLEKFELNRFYIIESTDLRTRPKEVLGELDEFPRTVKARLQYRHEKEIQLGFYSKAYVCCRKDSSHLFLIRSQSAEGADSKNSREKKSEYLQSSDTE